MPLDDLEIKLDTDFQKVRQNHHSLFSQELQPYFVVFKKESTLKLPFWPGLFKTLIVIFTR